MIPDGVYEVPLQINSLDGLISALKVINLDCPKENYRYIAHTILFYKKQMPEVSLSKILSLLGYNPSNIGKIVDMLSSLEVKTETWIISSKKEDILNMSKNATFYSCYASSYNNYPGIFVRHAKTQKGKLAIAMRKNPQNQLIARFLIWDKYPYSGAEKVKAVNNLFVSNPKGTDLSSGKASLIVKHLLTLKAND